MYKLIKENVLTFKKIFHKLQLIIKENNCIKQVKEEYQNVT